MSSAVADITGIAKTISKDLTLNHTEMVQAGVKYIEELGGNNWSNYNPSDPGVVTLETLAFALLDLGYKSTFSMKDLLTDKHEKIRTYEKLYTPREVLFSNPVTISDFRKLLLDRVERIKNVWIEPVKPDGGFSGVCEVAFELDDAFKIDWLKLISAESESEIYDPEKALLLKAAKAALKTEIKEMRKGMEALLLQHRNLSEFFFRPTMLVPKAIELEGAIYLEKKANVEQTIAWIYYQLNNYLSTFIQFQDFDELKQLGESVGEIMSGPRMGRGFILDSSLTSRKKEIDPQVMKASLMSNQDILSLYAFAVNTGQSKSDQSGADTGLENIKIKDHESLFFDYSQVVSQLTASDTKLYFYHGDKLLTKVDQNRINTYYAQYTDSKAILSSSMEEELGPVFPTGNYRDVKKYHSIQSVFPQSFGLSLDQSEAGYTPDRLGQIKQLKAYVMLFEQIMADHQAQLSKLPELLSFDSGVKVTEPLCQTLFSQGLYDVPGAHWVLKAFESYKVDSQYHDEYPHENWKRFKNDPFNDYQAFLDNTKAHETKNIEHKNEVITHLYARLGGVYSKRSLLELNPHYDNYNLAQVEGVSGLLKQFWLYSENMSRSYFRPEFRIEQSHNKPEHFQKKFHQLFTGLEYKLGLTFELNAFYKGIVDAVTHGLQSKDKYLKINTDTADLIEVYYYDQLILSLPAGNGAAELIILEHMKLLKQLSRQTRGFVLIDNLLLIKQLENQSWNIEKDGKTIPLKPVSANSGQSNKPTSFNLRQVQVVLNRYAKKWKEAKVALVSQLSFNPLNANGTDSNSDLIEEVAVRSDDSLFKFSVSVMLPNWITAMNDPGFQATFQQQFAQEGPLHLNYQFQPLDYAQLEQVLTIRRPWLAHLKRMQQGHKMNAEALNVVGNMISFLQNLTPKKKAA